MKGREREFEGALRTAFIDREFKSERALQPRIIDNTVQPLCDVIGRALRESSSFKFSVAFVTESGLESILQPLKEALDEGRQGQLLTTNYLFFTEPKALERLLNFSPLLSTRVVEGAFHAKGYSFSKPDFTRTIIIGSSNLTQQALKTNREWNAVFSTMEAGGYTEEFERSFNTLWDTSTPLNADWIERYRKTYEEKKEIVRRLSFKDRPDFKDVINPNSMQKRASNELEKLRKEGKNKALIIAATGTGKTFLSCFDVKRYNPHRMLFVVHREQILKAAEDSFVLVLGTKIRKEIGFLAGGDKDYNKRYVFATIQSLSKLLDQRVIKRDHFDYIIIDEAHRAWADSYRKIFSFLAPDFILGMSATPDRSDAGNIYSLFDYNIACDIRLKEALENDLLCPFHYFGITDIEVDGQLLNEDADFRHLVSKERVKNIIEKSMFYGYSGSRVKGLVFCSRVEECKELSRLFNEQGFKTVAITGATPVDRRLEYTDRLQQDEMDGRQLDFIFSVDVFNEGVDIPLVNQIIMLRPTESAIIFIQQLGRGLRKAPGKDFVVIIDFIANYQRNYLIPVALSGDSSYNKDNLRRDVFECSRLIPGCSTVNFDPVARKLIYQKIEEASFTDAKFLTSQYKELKNKLGRIPSIADFREDGNIDIQRYVDKYSSYYAFLEKYEEEFTDRLNEKEKRTLAYISHSFSQGKRKGELEVLKKIINTDRVAFKSVEFSSLDPSVHSSLSLAFVKNVDREGRFCDCDILSEDGRISDNFLSCLSSSAFIHQLEDVVDDGLVRYSRQYSKTYKSTDLVLFEKYTYEDVCRLLKWGQDINAQNIGGYKYDEKTKTLPVFINYDKDNEAIRYEDHFVSPTELVALSKKKRGVDSKDADHIYKRTPEDRDNHIYLFVRKNKDDKEKKEFYFLGEMNATGEPREVVVDGDRAFEIDYVLETPVRDDIYDYLTSSLD